MSADIDVLVIGGGHGGLGVAARLQARGREPLVVDEHARIGDPWRERWASLRLFTPRFVNGLPGMRFPDGADPFPARDEVAEFHERYAAWRRIPLRLGARVSHVRPVGGAFEAIIAGELVRARNVVVATGAHRTPRLPPFAAQLVGPRQLHSREYGSTTIQPGLVLVVGARNSGAEIAAELARTHAVTLAVGAPTPYAPRRWRSPFWWRIAQLRSWALRGRIPPKILPWPLTVRTYVEVDAARLGRDHTLTLAPRAVDAAGDAVRLADGNETRPRTIIWATGFRVDDTWLDLPQTEDGVRVGTHRRAPIPGLWIVREGLLASLHWGALDVASDLERSGR